MKHRFTLSLVIASALLVLAACANPGSTGASNAPAPAGKDAPKPAGAAY